MGLVEYLQQTTADFFKVGLGGITINNNGGVAEVKNGANSSLATLRAADPTGDSDVATKGWAEANLSVANAVRELEFAADHTDMPDTTTLTIDSSDLPSGAIVKSIDIKVGSAFDGGVTLLAGTAADADAYIASGQASLTYTDDVQSFNMRGDPLAEAGPVQFTFTSTGTPSAGALSAWITYSVPAISA